MPTPPFSSGVFSLMRLRFPPAFMRPAFMNQAFGRPTEALELTTQYRSAFQNYIPIIWAMALKRQPPLARLRASLESVSIANGVLRSMYLAGFVEPQYDARTDTCSFRYHGRRILLRGAVFGGDIDSSFNDYRWMNPTGATVLDVGAGIGDSALYFALNGAAQVISIEPNQIAVGFAESNILSNELQNVVRVHRGACSGEVGTIHLMDDETPSPGFVAEDRHSGKPVHVYSLNSLLAEVDSENVIMKVDCEGCEYRFLRDNDRSLLRRFRQIHIEYHFGVMDLVRVLQRAQFRVRVSPYVSRRSSTGGPLKIGHVFAERIGG